MKNKTRHSVYQINYHFVWCPKYRRSVLTAQISDRLVQLIPQQVNILGGEIIELVVRPDHVHCLLLFHQTLRLNKLCTELKAIPVINCGMDSHNLKADFLLFGHIVIMLVLLVMFLLRLFVNTLNLKKGFSFAKDIQIQDIPDQESKRSD